MDWLVQLLLQLFKKESSEDYSYIAKRTFYLGIPPLQILALQKFKDQI